jgi:hypothetical protein
MMSSPASAQTFLAPIYHKTLPSSMGSHRLDLFRHGVDIIVTEERQASERLSTGKHSSLIMTPDYLA